MNKNLVIVACTNVGRSIILELLTNKKISTKISGVINLNKDRAIKKSNYDIANNYNLEILYVNSINDEICIKWLKKKKPNLIIQSGWSQKFSDKVLKIPKYGCIGEHPAPLPKGRGAACVNWAIINNEKKWGDSFFVMDNDYDNGPIVAQEFFKIEDYDNVKTIYDKVCATSRKIVSVNIDLWIQGNFRYKKQNINKATYFNKRSPDDGEFSLYDDVLNIHNKVRALTRPYPGAFFYLNNKKIFVWSSNVLNLKKRDLLKKKKNGGLVINVGKRRHQLIELLRVQVESQAEMWADRMNIGLLKKNLQN
jgi:methionyl-tRNA formyltransferase